MSKRKHISLSKKKETNIYKEIGPPASQYYDYARTREADGSTEDRR